MFQVGPLDSYIFANQATEWELFLDMTLLLKNHYALN